MSLSPVAGGQDRYPGPNQRFKDDLDRLIDELLMPSFTGEPQGPPHGSAPLTAAQPAPDGQGDG
ncbi:hypothetical protein ACFWWS_15625 [Streptomyces sp. NPDC059083]|uniref:hypothetical protein n=1 Tax=unclassified Streptomyces TaxID=2593676 RepID=UPI0036CF8E1B